MIMSNRLYALIKVENEYFHSSSGVEMIRKHDAISNLEKHSTVFPMHGLPVKLAGSCGI